MLSPTRGWLRAARAASFGVVGFVLALAAHVAAGGATPGQPAIVLLAALTGLAAVLLTGVRQGPFRVGVLVCAMQVVLHESFMWLGAPASCAMTAVGASAGGAMSHGGPPAPLFDCAAGMAQVGMDQPSVFAAPVMVGAHVAATAMIAALLAYGETVLWFLAGWALPPRWFSVGLSELPLAREVSSFAPPVLPVRVACGGVGRRGPPTRVLLAIG
jgi:hypothetical protein